MDLLDRYRGCLMGGAVGDALGYPVEFLTLDQIRAKYGPAGITGLDRTEGTAQISDDTQMSLFTANGLLYGETRRTLRGIGGPYSLYIWSCYQDWLDTQEKSWPVKKDFHTSWLINDPRFFHRRAPGSTCLSAIAGGVPGSMASPINHSKGCGGVMRVAPVGLYLMPEGAAQTAAEAAALTHGHELGWLPAAALAWLISQAVHRGRSLDQAAADLPKALKRLFPKARQQEELTALLDRAADLAAGSRPDPEAIVSLGEGWVAEEALAIALYCALRYPGDFRQAIIAAVNHSGDSDSTGALTGNLMGASLGLAAIPEELRHGLELSDVVLELADDLHAGCRAGSTTTSRAENGQTILSIGDYCDPVWERKYVLADYRTEH